MRTTRGRMRVWRCGVIARGVHSIGNVATCEGQYCGSLIGVLRWKLYLSSNLRVAIVTYQSFFGVCNVLEKLVGVVGRTKDCKTFLVGSSGFIWSPQNN